MSTTERTERLLRVGEVAEVLNVSTKTVERLADAGRLGRIRLGYRTVRYRPAEVADLIAERSESA